MARRYDVGVPALWKRREAEGWKRPDPAAGPIEPAEGWERFAADRAEALARHPDLAAAFWDEAGRLRPLWALDLATRRLNRDLWRETVGLPEGAAPFHP